MAEELTAEETEIYSDLAEQAGVVAQRLLAERGLIYLEDLAPEDARDVLRSAWREAARTRFDGQDLTELLVEIDAMVASLVMTGCPSEGPPVSIH